MRITLDWDIIDFSECKKRIQILRQYFPDSRIDLEKSAGGRGYHVMIYNSCKTYEEQLKLREKFWDDKKRIAIDRQRWEKGIPTNILFTEKGGKHVRKY